MNWNELHRSCSHSLRFLYICKLIILFKGCFYHIWFEKGKQQLSALQKLPGTFKYITDLYKNTRITRKMQAFSILEMVSYELPSVVKGVDLSDE